MKDKKIKSEHREEVKTRVALIQEQEMLSSKHQMMASNLKESLSFFLEQHYKVNTRNEHEPWRLDLDNMLLSRQPSSEQPQS